MKPSTLVTIAIFSGLNIETISAQQLNKLSGIVVTKESEPIEHVYIFAEKDSILKETFTDPGGKFELPLENGNYKLKGVYFSKILFEEELTVNSNLNLDTLRVSPNLSLNEIIVEAFHSPVSYREDKLIFDVQKLSKIEGYSANDILKYVPKVVIDFDGQLQVGSKPAAVYLNNRRLSSEEIILLNSLNAKDISEIEVQSTHGGEYGVDIQGGVIHIKTIKNRTGFNATAQFHAAHPKQDYYTLSPNLNLFFGKEKWNIYSTYSFNHGRGGSYSSWVIFF